MPNSPDTEPRFTVPGYTDVRLVGRGGFSTVWYAMQTQYERVVALKVLDVGLEDERTRRQFQRECAATGRLSGHPNIVTILDSGFTSQQMPYLAMDYCAQGSLLDRLRREGPLPVADVLRIGVKMCGALESAHQKDILHRDLKPENILVNAYGEPGLADFGIATVTARLESSVTMHALTPSHAPPEVLEGHKATELSDVYSLASTLYVLLAGRPAFSMGADPSILQFLLRVTSDPVPPIPRADVPQVVQDVLIAAMAKDPAHRYQSAAAFGQALQQLQAHLGYPVTELVTLVPGASPAVVPPPFPTPPASSVAPPGAAGAAPGWPPSAGAPEPARTSGSRAARTGPAPHITPPPPIAPAAASGAAGASGASGTWGAAPPAPAIVPSGAAPPAPSAAFDVAPVSPDATVLRPGADPVSGAPAHGSPAPAPSGPAVAPPLPSADLYGVPVTGSATVYHERAVPVIEPADLTAPPASSGPSPVLRALAVLVAVLLLAGVGYLGYERLRGSSSTSGAASTGPEAPTTSASVTSAPVTSVPATPSSAPPSTRAGDASGTTRGGGSSTDAAPPENVAVKALANKSLQVTWSDASGGAVPYVYEVVSPQGQQLSKISAVAPGTTSTVVTETNAGPIDPDAQTYCVAVGAIAGPGKPLWAPAPCTDGSTVTVA